MLNGTRTGLEKQLWGDPGAKMATGRGRGGGRGAAEVGEGGDKEAERRGEDFSWSVWGGVDEKIKEGHKSS